MTTLEILQALTNRNKSAGADTDKLKSVLDDYQVLLKELRSEKPEELNLRRLDEESRDFGRLITKGHGQILQGRISDGLRAIKSQLNTYSQPSNSDENMLDGPVDTVDSPSVSVKPDETEPSRIRNMPNLGMD